MRVLLVDDSPAVLASLGRLLRAEPDVEVVGSADRLESALAQVALRQPDVVVLDVDLAGGDRGYDVLRRIRADHRGVAVVMLSNFGWRSMRSAFLQAGAQAYFDKALEFGDAVAWIRRRAGRRPGSAASAADQGLMCESGPASRSTAA
jgi:two-component system response regulator DevR